MSTRCSRAATGGTSAALAHLPAAARHQLGHLVTPLLRALLLLALLLPGRAQATVYYVNGAQADNSGDGLSWAAAKRDVQEAINLAAAADEVWVKAGTYLPTLYPAPSSDARDRTFYLLAADLKLYGGFAGGETDARQRNPAANLTVLSGDLDPGAGANDAYHVLASDGRSSACVVDGFTVQAGRANGVGTLAMVQQPIERNRGGGMFAFASSLTVSNCTFSGNSATQGGGLYCYYGGSPMVSNCTFSGNSATQAGGGMNASNCSPAVSNCSFTSNSAGQGGGLTAGNARLTASNCIFSGNTATTTTSQGGGGMFINVNSSVSINSAVSNCTFSGNTVSTNGFGGGLYCVSTSGSTLALTNCVLYQNTTPNTTDAGREELYKASSTGVLTASYCIVRDARGTAPNLTVAGATLSNCYNTAPGYVDAAAPAGPDGLWRTVDDGLRLACGSFAVDLGTGSTPAADILGNPRKGPMDLGAYEAVGGSTPSNSIPAATTAVSGVQAAAAQAYTDCQNQLLQLNAAAPYTLQGSTAATVFVQATAPSFLGQSYVRRSYDVAPVANAAAATAEVTLYFTQADFDDYNAARGSRPSLPTAAADAEGYAANLRITQKHGTSATGAPGSYTGWAGAGPATVFLTPTAVAYNAAAARWEVTFPVAGFSGFFAHTGPSPLPVELAQFTATRASNAAVRLAWATASEKNSARFEAERSADGRTFAAIGTVAAAGSSGRPRAYELLDEQLPAGAARLYYRLKQVDLDGAFSYSPVRAVALKGAAAVLSLYPNPTGHGPGHGGLVTLTGTQSGAGVTVTDALGRWVISASADSTGTAALALPAGLPAGVYHVRAGSKVLRLTVD